MNGFDIEGLVADLKPVRRVKPVDAWLLVLGSAAMAVLLVALMYGLRSDVMAGTPAPMVLIRSGILLLLGTAALTAVVTAARPGVGQASHGWRWALAAAALFPAATILAGLIDGDMPMAELNAGTRWWCLGISLTGAHLIGTVLTLWLRQGAPVNRVRAGWLVGLTSGAFGTFAYSLHCPSSTVAYVGIWYTMAIAMAAVAGRLIVPRFIRW